MSIHVVRNFLFSQPRRIELRKNKKQHIFVSFSTFISFYYGFWYHAYNSSIVISFYLHYQQRESFKTIKSMQGKQNYKITKLKYCKNSNIFVIFFFVFTHFEVMNRCLHLKVRFHINLSDVQTTEMSYSWSKTINFSVLQPFSICPSFSDTLYNCYIIVDIA